MLDLYLNVFIYEMKFRRKSSAGDNRIRYLFSLVE